MDLRFPEGLVRFWSAKDSKIFVGDLRVLLKTADKGVEHHLDRRSVWPFRSSASVKLSSFCPCFVLLLVWALLFNNSCKSKLIGGKSIWKLFAKWPTPTDRESKCLCMRRIFTFFTLSRRSEEDGRNKGLSFISLTLVGAQSHHYTLLHWFDAPWLFSVNNHCYFHKWARSIIDRIF